MSGKRLYSRNGRETELGEFTKARILQLKAEGMPEKYIAENFNISITSLRTFLENRHENTKPAPRRVQISKEEKKAADKYGANKNPFECAEKYTTKEGGVAEYFKIRNGVKYYKGRIVSGMKIWHEIIREMNAIRKEQGKTQFSSNPEWVV